MASLSDSFKLSTRVANSLCMQIISIVFSALSFFLYPGFPRRHGERLPKRASLRYNEQQGIRTMTTPRPSLRVFPLRLNGTRSRAQPDARWEITFCTNSELCNTCAVAHTNLHQCLVLWSTCYCWDPFCRDSFCWYHNTLACYGDCAYSFSGPLP